MGRWPSAFIGILLGFSGSTAGAATITVTSLADDTVVNGQVTLREAIIAANTDSSVDGSTAGSGADTIVFATGSGTITLSGIQLPVITDPLTITGPGSGPLAIDGNGASRLFQVGAGVTAGISGLAIDNGRSELANGGGIYNSGTLTLTGVTMAGNETAFNGGGVYNDGVLDVVESTLSGNSAQNGGAVSNEGTLTIMSSTLAANFTGGIAPFAGGGGAIVNAGTATIASSTLDGNTAGNGGALVATAGSLTALHSSTVSGNGAINNAGALSNFAGALTITDSTVVGNRADSDGNTFGTGGGVRNAGGGALTLHQTIVAGNFEGTGSTTIDIDGAVESNGSFNVIGVDTRLSGISDGIGGNQIGTSGAPLDPLLSALQDNGGPTSTRALLPGSPAIDTGSNAICAATDQRGRPRPADGDGDGSSICDVGAYELEGISATKTVSGDRVENGSISYSIVIENRTAITQMDNPGDELTDTLPGSLTAVSATASSGSTLRSGNTVTWNGSIAPGALVTLTIGATVNAGTLGTLVSNQGTVNYDSDGDGTNDQSLLTDDPGVPGATDPTSFLVGSGPTDFYTLDPCRLIDT